MITVQIDPTCLEKRLTKDKKKEDPIKNLRRNCDILFTWMFNQKPGGVNTEATFLIVRIWNALPSNLLVWEKTPYWKEIQKLSLIVNAKYYMKYAAHSMIATVGVIGNNILILKSHIRSQISMLP